MGGYAKSEETGQGGYQLAIEAGGHALIADEPVALGGLDSGPAPYDLLCAALAACTSMTLRMYAQHKALPLAAVRVEVRHSRDPEQNPPDLLTRTLVVEGDLSQEQRERLLEIAQRCPVHKTLAGGLRIATALAPLMP